MSPVAAFALTLVVEVPLYGAALSLLELAGLRRALLLGVLVNLLTQPALWWFLAPTPSLVRLVLAEAVVCLVEAGAVWLAVRPRRAESAPLITVVSVGVNAASVLAGMLVSAAPR